MSRRRYKKPFERTELDKLVQKTRALLPNQDVRMTQNYPGEKMSEVLEAFMEPFEYLADTKAANERLVMTAIMAWNIACKPKAEEAAEIEKTIAIMPNLTAESRADFRVFLQTLTERKRLYFDANKRLIVNYQLTDTPEGGYHLSVASLAEPKP